MEQELPSSVQTERTVIGAILLDENALNDALEHLTAEDFLLDSHQKIFTSVVEMAETGNAVDTITVMEDLTRRRWLDSVGGAAYLTHLMSGIPRNPNIATYCRIVKDKSLLRQLAGLCNDGMIRAMDSSENSLEVMGELEEKILALSQQSAVKGFRTMLDALTDSGGLDAYVDQTCDPVALTGLPMGFKDVDAMMGGMKPGELIIIAGRPGSGKSSFAMNVVTNVARRDAEAVVAVFSLEMTEKALNKRMLSSLSRVTQAKMQGGFVGVHERSQIAGSARWLAERKINIDDTASLTPLQMRSRCRRLKQKEGRLDLVVIDYIQLLMGATKYGSREQEVAAISRSTKALAKELEVPVIALAQLNRAGETQGDRRPMLSSLRESGSLEQDADAVAFIHRQALFEPQNEDVKGLAEFILAKQREGPVGKVDLAYIPEVTLFANLELHRGDYHAD